MNYVIIFNGLGNQMSQYAFFLAKKHFDPQCRMLILDNPKSHNGYELNKVFKIENKETFIDKLVKWVYLRLYSRRGVKYILRCLGFTVIDEPRNYDYTPQLLKNKTSGINLYRGGWHTEKYFLPIEDEIRNIFVFDSNSQKNEEYQDLLEIIRQDNNSVSLHIRRGDYLNIKPNDYWQFGGVATDNYYYKCINYMQKHLSTPHFYVFSDDIEWCKKNLKLNNITFVTCNKGCYSWRDLHLISECRHHIMANSSFSWWGAWLSHYKSGITLHPQWFIRNVETKDFYSEKWICIK